MVNSSLKKFIFLFTPLLILELVFHFIQYTTIDVYSYFRIIAYISIISSIVTLLFHKNDKGFYIVSLIFLILISVYSFVELIFKNFMGDYYSFGTVSDGAARIAQYALIFIANAKLSYYLCFLDVIVFIILNKKIKLRGRIDIKVPVTTLLLSLIILLSCFNAGSGIYSIANNYGTFSNKDMIVEKMGINHFFFRDLTALFYKVPEKIEIEEPVEVIEVEPERKRTINDNNWKNILNDETNEDIKTIDKYLMSRSITPINEKTGEFENYNFIYFMVEAFDYLAIDKDLTPTLYKMFKNGYTFDNHYTPTYSCATGESEFVSYTSIFPYSNSCTPNMIYEDNFYEALPYLFKNKGYSTFALHNWRDEFYERNTLLPNLGFDKYYDIDEIWKDSSIVHTNGWQSDAMLIEQAIKHIDETDSLFFCNIITAVMHFPYNESSYWGDYYLEDVRKVHPDWDIDYQRYLSKCMDFDHGLEILLKYLEDKGLADNTVIAIYADHRPYWMDYDVLIDYTSHLNDRSSENGVYSSPFIIYNKNLKANVNHNYCSSMDHVPTIANLFNLRYDPRLYIGEDIYNGDSTVIFTNGNWLNKDGNFDVSSETFTPFNDNTVVNQQTILNINNNVSNKIKISYLILDNAYFSKRKGICYPRY